jgi:hypothetical protein
MLNKVAIITFCIGVGEGTMSIALKVITFDFKELILPLLVNYVFKLRAFSQTTPETFFF